MKYILTLFALLVALPASAQTYFREGTTQWLEHDSSTAYVTTSPFAAQTRYIRLTSTSAVYYAIGLTDILDDIVAARQSTGFYLPANVDRIVRVSPGQVLIALSVSSSGTITVTELTQ